MASLDVASVIEYPWEAVGLVWLAAGAFTKRTVRSQAVGIRIFYLALIALGFTLLSSYLAQGWLGRRFLTANQSLDVAGLVVTIAGCAFAIWARLALGSNWSGKATVKANHELVTSGPYAVARHPIYTGLLLAVVGTALAEGEWHGLLACVLILLAFIVKMSQEERLMMQTFPAAYPAYRLRVKALIPGIF